jgi:uncharacterized MAPEG superfamily protein
MVTITALTALILFAALTLLLMFVVVNYRVLKILTGTPADHWTRGNANTDPPWVTRLAHAHLNCLEILPILAVLVLVSTLIGKSQIAEPLAAYVLYARVAQVITHAIGVNHWLVLLRATFFTIQAVLFVIMFVRLLA